MSELLPELPDFCWPVDLSCVDDWDALTDPDAPADPEDNPPIYSDAQKAWATSLAGQSMRLLTAYRVGGCPITVRPCQPGCVTQTWRAYPVGGPSTPWMPVQLGGQWLNIGCGHAGGCPCSRVSEVRLHGPASMVTTVKVDGVTLDASAYRLDRTRQGTYLVRIDGQDWPLCQDMKKADTEDGTWSVSYLPAAPVDGLGARAAGALAGQYVRACTGGDCDLPESVVTQVNRQGITLTLTPGVFPGGKTGIREVDAYLERWNPEGHRGPPATVWSPDLAQHRITGA